MNSLKQSRVVETLFKQSKKKKQKLFIGLFSLFQNLHMNWHLKHNVIPPPSNLNKTRTKATFFPGVTVKSNTMLSIYIKKIIFFNRIFVIT